MDGAAEGKASFPPNPAQIPARCAFWGDTHPPRPDHAQQSDKTLHVWRTPASGGSRRNSLITAYTSAIMSSNTILSCISQLGLPPFSAASMERPIPLFTEASRAPLPPSATSERQEALIPALPAELIPGRFSAPLVSAIKAENSNGPNRLKGRRLPRYSDPSSHRHGNAPGRGVAATR